MNKTILKGFLSIFAACVLFLGTGPSIAEGACGAAASSCKNCHEIQGKKKVNSQGAWHKEHGFADFCVFCHGGSTTATTKDKAHKGMIKPLENIEKSCSACHPDDYRKRAKKYNGGTNP